jgi:hypothetical protein
MVKLPLDDMKFTSDPVSPIVEATLSLVQDMVRKNWQKSGLSWQEFVFGASNGLQRTDFEAIERRILQSGHRFEWSAAISVADRPDAYKGGGAAEDLAVFSFEHPEAPAATDDGDGRILHGIGDNVVRYPANIIGTARYVRSNERVLQYLTEGVPPGTIAVIDDSGGTLTAPIVGQFAGVICAGGTVRSHLGILTREYGIPCFMNAKISGIRDGDKIEFESTAMSKSADDYQKGIERTGRVWRLSL